MSKKKKKSQGQQFLSPEKYIKERVRSLQIGDCFFSDGLPDEKFGIVFVTRLHNGGKRSIGQYLIDMMCLGVKDSAYHLRLDDREYETWKEHYEETCGLKKVSYNEAHNLVHGAVDFAEEAGIEPHKSWNLTMYFLEEDDEDIPLIEYDYGHDGMHFLMAESVSEAEHYLPIMEKHLGLGNFHYTIKVGDRIIHEDDILNGDDIDEHDRQIEEKHRRWRENDRLVRRLDRPYTYKHPKYPEALEVENEDILPLLTTYDKGMNLSDEEIDSVLAHDRHSLKKDLENIILYYIGRDCDIKEGEDHEGFPAIANSLMFLAEVGDADSLDVIFELMRQTWDMMDWELCDIKEKTLVPALVKLGKDNLPKLWDFMMETGIDNFHKIWLLAAVQHIATGYPEKADEVHQWFSDLIDKILSDYPKIDYTDGTVNGNLVGCLVEIHAKDLLPRIAEMYDLDIVSNRSYGDYQDIVELFMADKTIISSHREYDTSKPKGYNTSSQNLAHTAYAATDKFNLQKGTVTTVVLKVSNTNGIGGIQVDNHSDDTVYSVGGMRVSDNGTDNLPHGIYIVNGKKVVR